MKKTTFIGILFLFVQAVSGQDAQPTLSDSISVYFKEIKSSTNEYHELWNKDLYGAMLLVDPQTRQVYANEADTAGILQAYRNVYAGILPDNINIANTSIDWNGKRWAMIRLPLPQNKYNRIALLAHELFHKAQPSLGFDIHNARNNHLNEKNGRIYLRFEMEALKKAVQADSKKELHQHLTNAMVFRKYRHSLYEGSGAAENTLELNEGIAEYTGVIVSGRSKKQTEEYFVNLINQFFTFPTFVRSFANHTIPVYGYLLYQSNKNWNREITNESNLTNYFIRAFNLDIPADLKKTVENISGKYNGKAIFAEERAREEKIKNLISEYKSKFIEQAHFEIQLEDMSISFNPSNIVPIEGEGTVYPTMRVTDVWGILIVENGALMSSDWDRISLTNPTKIEGEKIVGNGWTLELTKAYSIEKDETSNNYQLIKK